MASAHLTGASAQPISPPDRGSGGLASVPSAVVAAPSVEPGFRLVPVQVGRPGERVTVYAECPAWCLGHEPVGAVEDINHQGAPAVLNLAADQVVCAPIAVSLSWWPGSDGVAANPCLAVDVDCEVAVYGRTGALAVADQLVAFAENVRRLAETLHDDSPTVTLAPSAVTS